MKEKRWILFKVAVYASLAMLFTFCSFIVYFYFKITKLSLRSSDVLYFSIFILLALISLLFHFQNARLIKFLNSEDLFTPSFQTYHTILLVCNCFTTIGWCILLFGLLLDTKSPYFHWRLQGIMMMSILAIGFLSNLYSIIGALKLRTYLKIKHQRQQDDWIEQMAT